ncbi:MAG: Phosphoglycerate kinase [Parcubacteria group bacterium GW2011_GWF2_39_13b]|nr:MAG: Phosphoglycerate kinase [Parcubacteria group bacterium GW2011_GWF2_39_13b]
MQFLRNIDVSNKRVLVRADFNVDLDKDGRVIDDFRIKAVIPTIEYLIKNNAKVILMSHLGDPKAGVEEKLRLGPVQDKLMEYLDLSVVKADDCIGSEIEKWTQKMDVGEILLLENLRFHKEEKENDENFAKELAKMGDIYVNDAFSVCHRDHASVVAITKFLPSFAGLLLEKEMAVLKKAMEAPEHPLAIIIGGAKISTKIKIVKKFLNLADDILLGGALANTVLRAKGIAIGKSIVEEEMVQDVKNLEITNTKIHIPVDTVVSVDKGGKEESREAPVGKMEENELILDIGPETENLFSQVIKNAKTIIWNGPVGLFEIEKFAHGTEAVARAVANCQCYSIVGGGETICYINKLGLADKFSHISTGGGAMLKFMAGEKLPGIEALNSDSNIAN